jgi:hypothetical protein
MIVTRSRGCGLCALDPPLDVLSVDLLAQYADAPLTVTLVVQSECPYCAASVPFYQKLATLRKTLRFQLVAASLESSRTMTSYVKERGIDVDRVANLKPGDIDTSGTPTLCSSAGTARSSTAGWDS